MGCCNDSFSTLPTSEQNPTQHVYYTKGMVLGVDDFTQEFTYLANRDQWAVRDLFGYGTISGLSVFIDQDTTDRLHVTQGTAAVPSGKLVCVPEDQCAVINDWLAKAKDDEIKPDADSKLFLYVTLSYKDCPTMPVPILGDPCRSEGELTANSRIADSYCLELRTKEPSQIEEDALRDFITWLKQIVTNNTGDFIVIDQWLIDLKKAIDSINTDTTPSVFFEKLGKLPLSKLVVPATKKSDFLLTAFRFWNTDLKPRWMNYIGNKIANPDQDCVLLAKLTIPVVKTTTNKWTLDNSKANQIDQSQRPYLVSMRLLQEWLTNDAKVTVTRIHTNLTLDATHHCVICEGDLNITLPSALGNQGKVYIIKSQKGTTIVHSADGDEIDEDNFQKIAVRRSYTIISDGIKTWHIIAKT